MTLRLGADCYTDVALIPADVCCPPDICEISKCTLICSFIQLLPSGPLWDVAKATAFERYQTDCNGVNSCDDCGPCGSLVDYAIYNAVRLHDLLLTVLWPALRESNPDTAVTTLDEWLDRLGWQDCYHTACRDPRLGNLTPYEIPSECGPIFCPVEVPEPLQCAVKRGIVRSLHRLNMGIIKNLCSINWVIEPLGAVVTPYRPDCYFEGENVGPDEYGPCCTGFRWQICSIDGKIEECPPEECHNDNPVRIDTLVERDPCTLPAGAISKLRPNVLAAECIVRSLLPEFGCDENNLVRCPDC